MRYRRSAHKKNPYLEPVGIKPGSVWMHTGRTRVEPVEFLGFTRYGSGSSWGDPSVVEVRALTDGRTISTTVDRLRSPREGEVSERRNPRKRKNPSAVYGAFRARNPKLTTLEQAIQAGVRAIRDATGASVDITPTGGGGWCISGMSGDVIKARKVMRLAGLKLTSSVADDPELPGERFDYWAEK